MANLTPIYPRPDEGRIEEAMSCVFRVVENIPPKSFISAGSFIKTVIVRGVTVAQAMWAIHELMERGGFAVSNVRDNRTGQLVITDAEPFAGLEMAAGILHIGGSAGWGDLVFSPDHQRLESIRRNLSIDVDSPQKSHGRWPDNIDVSDLCKLLAKRKRGESLIGIARRHTREDVGNCPKASSLLRQARRYRHLWDGADN